MSWLTRPHVWLALALLIVTGVGAVLLADPACTRVEEEFLQVYHTRHEWQAAFDALSATCGVGLLTYNFEEDYTPRGRWTLTALGVIGAVLYLLAATQALRRLATAGTEPGRYIGDKTAGTEPGRYVGDVASAPRDAGARIPSRTSQATGAEHRPPHPVLVAAVFLAVLAVLLPLFWLAERAAGAEAGFSDAAWRASAAFASLGWTRDPHSGLDAWPVAVVAWIGALGWTTWVVVVPALRRRCVPVRGLCVSVGGYVCFLLIAAGLMCALESPRAGRRGMERDGKALSSQPPVTRYAQSLVQTVCASGAGIPTEALSDRGVTEGTKMTLAAVSAPTMVTRAAADGGPNRWCDRPAARSPRFTGGATFSARPGRHSVPAFDARARERGGVGAAVDREPHRLAVSTVADLCRHLPGRVIGGRRGQPVQRPDGDRNQPQPDHRNATGGQPLSVRHVVAHGGDAGRARIAPVRALPDCGCQPRLDSPRFATAVVASHVKLARNARR